MDTYTTSDTNAKFYTLVYYIDETVEQFPARNEVNALLQGKILFKQQHNIISYKAVPIRLLPFSFKKFKTEIYFK